MIYGAMLVVEVENLRWNLRLKVGRQYSKIDQTVIDSRINFIELQPSFLKSLTLENVFSFSNIAPLN